MANLSARGREVIWRVRKEWNENDLNEIMAKDNKTDSLELENPYQKKVKDFVFCSDGTLLKHTTHWLKPRLSYSYNPPKIIVERLDNGYKAVGKLTEIEAQKALRQFIFTGFMLIKED